MAAATWVRLPAFEARNLINAQRLANKCRIPQLIKTAPASVLAFSRSPKNYLVIVEILNNNKNAL